MTQFMDGPLTETSRPAGIRCGHCKQTHPTVADVAACYGAPRSEAATEAQVSYAQQLLRTKHLPERYATLDEVQLAGMSKRTIGNFIAEMKRQKNTDRISMELTHPEIPEGYYALTGPGDQVLFYKIVDWKTARGLYSVFGSPGAFDVRRVTRNELAASVMDRIAEDPRAASLRFGREVGVCGVCGSPLTNDESRALGIGPKCRRKRGY